MSALNLPTIKDSALNVSRIALRGQCSYDTTINHHESYKKRGHRTFYIKSASRLTRFIHIAHSKGDWGLIRLPPLTCAIDASLSTFMATLHYLNNNYTYGITVQNHAWLGYFSNFFSIHEPRDRLVIYLLATAFSMTFQALRKYVLFIRNSNSQELKSLDSKTIVSNKRLYISAFKIKLIQYID